MQANATYVALGTNMAHAGVEGADLLAQAVAALRAAGLAPRNLSGIWRSPAWPPSDQPDFFNAVAELDQQSLSPQQLYEKFRAIEQSFGRERRIRWGPRTLDLDLIDVPGQVGTFGEVTLPHKHMHERGFVLAPLAEIAPDWRHPVLGRSVGELLGALPLLRLDRVGSFPSEA